MVLTVEIDNQRAVENSIHHQLLEAIKNCQIRFGGKTELATELDPSVARLCSIFELALCHGLKTSDKVPNPIRQVTDLVGVSSVEKFSIWDVVQNHLTSHEKERYELLRQIWSNKGRGRAWLRSAINERSLERCLKAIIVSGNLHRYYEDWAFMASPEFSSILPDSAAGLSSILFALSIDRPELNYSSNGEDHGQNAIGSSETVIEEPEPGKKKEDKRSKKGVNIISFGDEDSLESPSQVDSDIQEQSLIVPFVTAVLVDEEGNSREVECAVEATGVLDQDFSNSDNETKDESNAGASNASAILRLLSNSTLGDLIPVSACDENQSSEDSISVPSCSEEGDTSSTGAVDRLKNEVLDIKALNDKLEKMQETNTVLSSKLIQSNASFKQQQLKYEQRLQDLARENEALKQSLRKYVSAVQLLKQDGTNFEGEDLYQQKLVQVAEMHGELMELNDRLQRNMVSKDIIIKRLYLELEALRGPLGPTEIDVCSQIISLWVPSVFLSGLPKAHHVYQIHARIGSEEWNVYRRYSEFYELHQETKKLYPVISAFQFPPKKTIGNKDSKFVEDRRLKLQIYLRRLVNHLVANNPLLSSSVSKITLIANIPFFGESQEAPSLSTSARPSARSSSAHQYAGL